MADNFNIFDICEQNINFLFGAGASFGFLPTLQLEIKDDDGVPHTFETLAKSLDEGKHDHLYALLFMYYYKKCIKPGLPRIRVNPLGSNQVEVIKQYKRFLKTVLVLLDKQGRTEKKCNIYTTNYDSCFEVAADSLRTEQHLNMVINDGSEGFQTKWFHTKNYNNRVVQKGIFDRHENFLPQINLLHPHGSVYWEQSEKGIQLNYGKSRYDKSLDDYEEQLSLFGNYVEDTENTSIGLLEWAAVALKPETSFQEFMADYNKIPIVNPTKWKFHETVFEEAYYQILRHLSFELERPNSVLVTFGFSFADEHILQLVQRSLSNPSLTIYICCYNKIEKQSMKQKFKGFENVKYISYDFDLNFELFNNHVFTLKKEGE